MAGAATERYRIIGPGKVLDQQDNQVINYVSVQDGFVYDTVNFTTVTAGTSQTLFTNNLNNKNRVDTNIKQAGTLPFGYSMECHKILVQILSTVGSVEQPPLDIKQLIDALKLEVQVDDFFVVNNPINQFPAGLGVFGQTNGNAQGVITNGMPATELIAPMLAPIYIDKLQTLAGQFIVEARTWITNYSALTLVGAQGSLVRCLLYGKLVKAAFNK
jgi:hypothetical protein